MSAQYGAPGLGRAQIATPAYSTARQGSSIPIPTGSRTARVTRRAMAVAAATLCAPVMATAALAGIGAAGGGNHAEMGSLAGTQGLRGATVEASSPAPTVSGPQEQTSRGFGKDAIAPTGRSHPAPPARPHSQGQQTSGQGGHAPVHKAPTHKAPA